LGELDEHSHSRFELKVLPRVPSGVNSQNNSASQGNHAGHPLHPKAQPTPCRCSPVSTTPSRKGVVERAIQHTQGKFDSSYDG
jgi:hypothetical protein